MPCVEIAEGVTSFGRRYILMVKRGIERDMPWPDQFFSYLREKVDGAGIAPPDGFRSWEAAIRAGHYRPICISGDTDSVMVAWPACYHIEPCILLGKHASKWCTETLFHARGRKDMNLAWEKAMRNALFTAPKRYAYGYVKEDGKMDHLEVKGNERHRTLSRHHLRQAWKPCGATTRRWRVTS
jgi:DNA polymerase elongation subunit (family B)